MSGCRVTLFTPTYNRAGTLPVLYRSIQRQTSRDFEWLIIDDGSEDGTEELVLGWIGETNGFPIRYYKVSNGGKCRAINRALDLAEGELFFVIDSDDYLTENAVERVLFWDSSIGDRSGYAGLFGNKGTSESFSPNTGLGQAYADISALSRYPDGPGPYIDGERADIWYTEVHRKYKYPVFEGEKFMTEAVAWNRMAADGLKIRAFDEILIVYSYREDGLTKAGNRLFLANPRGYGLFLREKALFCGYPFGKMFRLWYAFYCEMCFCEKRYRLTRRQCAEYIGAPLRAVYICSVIKKIRGLKKG
jgi:glycosyltransferase involved in cell wall biosynthesis